MPDTRDDMAEISDVPDWPGARRVPTVRGGYELTPRGRALEPVILELERWGWSVLGEPADDEIVTDDALAIARRSAFQPKVGVGTPPTEYVLHVDGGTSVAAVVAGGRLDVVPIGADALPRPRPGSGAEVHSGWESRTSKSIAGDGDGGCRSCERLHLRPRTCYRWTLRPGGRFSTIDLTVRAQGLLSLSKGWRNPSARSPAAYSASIPQD